MTRKKDNPYQKLKELLMSESQDCMICGCSFIPNMSQNYCDSCISDNFKGTAPVIPLEQKLKYEVFRLGDYAIIKMPADPTYLQREGEDMRHCLVYAYKMYAAAMERGETEQYSLIDLNTGEPHVDIEVAITKPTYSRAVKHPTVTQIRGKENQCPPDDKFIDILVRFLKEYGKERGWQLFHPGHPNFDGKLDGHLVIRRDAELKGLSSSARFFINLPKVFLDDVKSEVD